MRIQVWIPAVMGTACWIAASGASPAATYYSVADLGNLSGPLSSAVNVNTSGMVAGLAMVGSGNFHATLWSAGPTDLGTLGADTQSMAYAVNDAASVTGISYNYGDLSPHAFLWQGGALTALGNFSPRDMNNAGAIVGRVASFSAAYLWVDHACIWTSGNLSDLGTLGGSNSEAMAVNAAGVVAGQAFLPNNSTLRACVWMGGTAHDLGTLAGIATAQSGAADINDNGYVVGWSDAAGGAPHACVFHIDANGAVLDRTDLGILGAGHSYAHGVNNALTVVGSSNGHGFVWSGGAMADLNGLISSTNGWTITKACAVNDNGVIVGEGVRFGFGHAVKLIPFDCLKGDMNGDGGVDGRDIDSFLRVVVNGGTAAEVCAGDVSPTPDGQVSPADVDAFVQCVLNGSCPIARAEVTASSVSTAAP